MSQEQLASFLRSINYSLCIGILNVMGSGSVIRGFKSVLNWPVRFLGDLFGFRRGRITGRGTVGRAGRSVAARPAANWRCQTCTFDNSGLLSECEMCGTGRGGGGSSSQQDRHDYYDSDGLSLDELRRRRIERFGR